MTQNASYRLKEDAGRLTNEPLAYKVSGPSFHIQNFRVQLMRHFVRVSGHVNHGEIFCVEFEENFWLNIFEMMKLCAPKWIVTLI